MTKDLKSNQDGTFTGTAVCASNTSPQGNKRWLLTKVEIGGRNGIVVDGILYKNNVKKKPLRIKESLDVVVEENEHSLSIVFKLGDKRIL